MTIRFEFDEEKLVNTLAYFASKGVKELGALKSMKLLFFADKAHLLQYGRPILGDRYSALPHGPVPSLSYSAVRDVFASDPSTPPLGELLFDEFLAVDSSGKHPEFVTKKVPDLEVFSESEIRILDEVIERYGSKTPSQVRNLTHEDPIWCQSRRRGMKSADIPYERFFEVQNSEGARQMLQLVESQQEDRDLAEELASYS